MGAPAKAKKAAKPKSAPAHPTYKAMSVAAITALKDRTGSSRQAILKYIVANYKVGEAARAGKLLNAALKKAVAGGALKMAAAPGKKNSGCYKVAEKPKVEKKKAKKPAKKPAAKKAKKPAPKKAAKKSPAKKAAKKSPAKKAAKKPAAKKPA